MKTAVWAGLLWLCQHNAAGSTEKAADVERSTISGTRSSLKLKSLAVLFLILSTDHIRIFCFQCLNYVIVAMDTYQAEEATDLLATG